MGIRDPVNDDQVPIIYILHSKRDSMMQIVN